MVTIKQIENETWKQIREHLSDSKVFYEQCFGNEYGDSPIYDCKTFLVEVFDAIAKKYEIEDEPLFAKLNYRELKKIVRGIIYGINN